MNEDMLALMIPIIAVAGGLFVGLVAVIMQPFKIRAKQAAVDEARKSYERLVMQKLDVIKTAVTMGYKQDEVADLDRRLESVIGSDKLQELLGNKVKMPLPSADLLDTDLMTEMEKIREKTKLKA